MSVRRIEESERCPQCYIKKMWCYCDQLKLLDSKNSVTIVMHKREYFLTSNTAHIIPLVLHNGKTVLKERESGILSEQDLFLPDREIYMLYPDEKAVAIEELNPKSPIQLIVPDGTWVQARKMGRREPLLKNLPTVSITPTEKSRYFLRKQGREHGVCTYEAVAYAMKHLEGEELYQKMMNQFEKVLKRLHESRQGVTKRDEAWKPKDNLD